MCWLLSVEGEASFFFLPFSFFLFRLLVCPLWVWKQHFRELSKLKEGEGREVLLVEACLWIQPFLFSVLQTTALDDWGYVVGSFALLTFPYPPHPLNSDCFLLFCFLANCNLLPYENQASYGLTNQNFPRDQRCKPECPFSRHITVCGNQSLPGLQVKISHGFPRGGGSEHLEEGESEHVEDKPWKLTEPVSARHQSLSIRKDLFFWSDCFPECLLLVSVSMKRVPTEINCSIFAAWPAYSRSYSSLDRLASSLLLAREPSLSTLADLPPWWKDQLQVTCSSATLNGT